MLLPAFLALVSPVSLSSVSRTRKESLVLQEDRPPHSPPPSFFSCLGACICDACNTFFAVLPTHTHTYHIHTCLLLFVNPHLPVSADIT